MAEPIHPKNNNFGALRLLFASLVIFAHSSPILLGDAAVDPHFASLPLGQMAVDGFFLISGYLITKSYVGLQNVPSYFKRRILRIYPAYFVNGMLCTFLLAPLVGAGWAVFHPSSVADALLRFSMLNFTKPDGVFPTMPMTALNGSAWTVAYEFRCYILVVLLGLAGAYRRGRAAVALGALACLSLNAADVFPHQSGALAAVFGSLPYTVRLTGVFMIGMLFYLYRERIPYTGRLAAGCALAVAAAAFVPLLSEAAYAVFGGYVIFWFAMRFRVLAISRFANETDLSYGIYLYAWPIQMAIAFADRSIAPLALSFLALALSAALAWVSWTLVEKPALRLAHRRREARRPDAQPSAWREAAN